MRLRRGTHAEWAPKALRVARLAAAIAVVAMAILGCESGNVKEAGLDELVDPGAAAGFNVLLVTMDTTRADRFGCYGYTMAETPVCDALASHGVRFDDAVTSVPLTLPSHATVLTGLLPRNHNVHENGKSRLAEKHVSIAEVLSSVGYDTGAFVGCFVLDSSFGLDQGFDVYDFDVDAEGYRPNMPDFNERPASAVTDSAIGWLDRREAAGATSPFFMWVHYFDPHLPYTSVYQRLPRFASRPYDAEITFADYHLGRLVERLEQDGTLNKTIIVLAADHGEALGEHDEPTHGMFLYEGTLRVPLIISCPALFDGANVVSDRVVGLVDIRATIEDLLGISSACPGDGMSLLNPDFPPDRSIYIETENPLNYAGWSPLYGLRTHEYKYVLAPTPELYDLTSDPTESRNVYAPNDPVSASLERALGEFMSGNTPDTGITATLSDEEILRLGSLGYIVTSARPRRDSLPDPKTMMSVYNDALTCEALYASGSFEKAAILAESVLEQSPDLTAATRVLAFSYMKLGRAQDAVDLLRSSVGRNPDIYLIRSLAQLLILEERYPEAEEVLTAYQAVDAHDGRVPLLRGDIRVRQNRPQEALAQYEAALELDANRVGVAAHRRISDLMTQLGR